MCISESSSDVCSSDLYFDNTLLIPGPADPVPTEACRTAARSKLSRKDWKRRLVMHRLLFALPLLLLKAAAPPDVTGHWVTEDGTGLLAISRCGNSVCGKVAKAMVIKPEIGRASCRKAGVSKCRSRW